MKAQATLPSNQGVPMGLSPNLFLGDLTAGQVNNQNVSSSIMDSGSTLSDPTDESGTSVADVISSAIGAVPGLILLSRTPQNRLPPISGVQNPVTGGTTIVTPKPATPLNINLIFIVIVLAIVSVMIFKKG